jgi:protein-S-isoprenylcysteine O-methyltransferase Ste14
MSKRVAGEGAKPMTKLKMAATMAITTPLYLALPVLGEGGLSATMAKPAVVAAFIITTVSAMAALFTEASVSPGVREDRANRWVLAAFGVLGLLGGFLPAWCDRTGTATIDGEAVRWAGVVVYAVGVVLRMAPVFVLGKRFSGLVAIQEGHTLVTDGIYGLVRNPSYLGFVLMSLGWGLAFNAWVGVLLTVLMIPPLVARMDSEERLLASEFGADYEAFRARTWRLLPWVY